MNLLRKFRLWRLWRRCLFTPSTATSILVFSSILAGILVNRTERSADISREFAALFELLNTTADEQPGIIVAAVASLKHQQLPRTSRIEQTELNGLSQSNYFFNSFSYFSLYISVCISFHHHFDSADHPTHLVWCMCGNR